MAENVQLTGKQFLVLTFYKLVAAAMVLAVIVFLLDGLILRFRVSRKMNAFGTVNVRPYYAVPRKDGKTELMFDDRRDETCVNSLLPHLGDAPCWYLRSHPEKRIDM